jgi:uncharacterized membrane protein
MSFFKGIISKEVSNGRRQAEIDLVRGLAVLFMILVHVSNEFLEESYNNTAFAKVIDFFGCVPAAPVFMFVMGVGSIYSKNQSPGKLLKRGLVIFAGGYALNFFRGFLPQIIGEQLGYYDIPFSQSVEYILAVDILQFAGLAMIIVSLLKFLRISPLFYPLFAVPAGVAAPYLWGTTSSNPVLKFICLSLFGGQDYTFHPVFSWIFYPLMGAFFGWFLIRARKKTNFYLITGMTSLLIICAAFIYYYIYPGTDLGILTGNIYNYYHHGILSNIIFCSSVIWWVSVWSFLSEVLPPFIIKHLTFWSKSVTVIYVIHWLLIGWSEYLIFDSFNIWQTVILMFIFIILTDRIADLYTKIKERLADREEVDIPIVLETTRPEK